MKAYSVVEYYYNNCDVWPDIVGYYFSEDRAYEHSLEIQSKYEQENLNPNNYWVAVEEIELIGDIK